MRGTLFKHNAIFDRITNCLTGFEHMLWAADLLDVNTGLFEKVLFGI